MKRLKVVYRALFRQPIGALNKLGAKITCPVPVEARPVADAWIAAAPNSTAVFEAIPRAASADSLKASVAEYFEEKLSDWVMLLPDGTQPVMTSLVIRDGAVFQMEPEDYTHIQNSQRPPSSKNLAYALCGGEFRHVKFASTLENAPPPTCEICNRMLQASREVTE